MTTEAQRRAVQKYDAKTTKQIHLKLNLKTDVDIITALEAAPSAQGYIKALIRANLAARQK